MLQKGDKIGIVCCSNGQKKASRNQIDGLEQTLHAMGLQPVFSEYIYEKESVFSGTDRQRAEALMQFYRDDAIKGICDISGGDLANGILPYLNYDDIAKSEKQFWGYSDLTTVLNVIYAKTGKASVLYQIRNLLYDHREKQCAAFENMLAGGTDLFRINYRFLQKKEMHGVVVGGNIRCFLKLAGTEYMPDLKDKILLLESRGGAVPQIATYLCQLQQLGAFEKVAGILLGTFTEMETQHSTPTVETLVKEIAGKDLPIAVTRDIGHGTDASAMLIGKKYTVF